MNNIPVASQAGTPSEALRPARGRGLAASFIDEMPVLEVAIDTVICCYALQCVRWGLLPGRSLVFFAGLRRGQAMRMYSWKTWEGIGEVLVEPCWIAWDSDASVAALAYHDSLVLCRTQPSLSAFATLSLQVRSVIRRSSSSHCHLLDLNFTSCMRFYRPVGSHSRLIGLLGPPAVRIRVVKF